MKPGSCSNPGDAQARAAAAQAREARKKTERACDKAKELAAQVIKELPRGRSRLGGKNRSAPRAHVLEHVGLATG